MCETKSAPSPEIIIYLASGKGRTGILLGQTLQQHARLAYGQFTSADDQGAKIAVIWAEDLLINRDARLRQLARHDKTFIVFGARMSREEFFSGNPDIEKIITENPGVAALDLFELGPEAAAAQILA